MSMFMVVICIAECAAIYSMKVTVAISESASLAGGTRDEHKVVVCMLFCSLCDLVCHYMMHK